jgi:hypothetical protein
VIVSLPVNSLIAEQRRRHEEGRHAVRARRQLRAFPNEIMVQGRGVAASDADAGASCLRPVVATASSRPASPATVRTELDPETRLHR